MATKRSTGGSAKSARTTAKSAKTTAKSAKTTARSAKTTAKSAGKPVVEGAARSRSPGARPTPEELDLRDRLKSQPRRPAGPPLVGDVQTRSAMDALRNEVLPKPTDPTGTGS